MPPLQTVILHHTTDAGSHYDWLMQCPAHDPLPDGRLWTARIELPPGHWPMDQRIGMRPIDPHRPAYLTYEGPISGNRGHVRRVAQGHFIPDLWTPGQRIVRITWSLPALSQRVHLHLQADGAWFIVSPQ